MKTSSATPTSAIALYQSEGGSVEVRLGQETVWLTQKQMSSLFGKDVRTVSEHLKNVFKEGELKQKDVTQDIRIAASDGKMYPTQCYNLDAILSVGYRVSSKQGTQFRIWATQLLKQHLLKGYTVNRSRLQERGLKEFERAVALIRSAVSKKRELTAGETEGLLTLISGYAKSWMSLKQYDEKAFPVKKVRTTRGIKDLGEDDALAAIALLKKDLKKKGEAGDSFGEEREPGALKKILRGTGDSYLSIEERAAELLYDVITEAPFADGNKRIGSFLFVLFISRHRKGRGEERVISDAALVALAVLIAQSREEDKDVILRLVETLL